MSVSWSSAFPGILFQIPCSFPISHYSGFRMLPSCSFLHQMLEKVRFLRFPWSIQNYLKRYLFVAWRKRKHPLIESTLSSSAAFVFFRGIKRIASRSFMVFGLHLRTILLFNACTGKSWLGADGNRERKIGREGKSSRSRVCTEPKETGILLPLYPLPSSSGAALAAST